jgi:hypothetical protein
MPSALLWLACTAVVLAWRDALPCRWRILTVAGLRPGEWSEDGDGVALQRLAVIVRPAELLVATARRLWA